MFLVLDYAKRDEENGRSNGDSHSMFVKATHLVCHRLISSWKSDLNTSLAALELLGGLARTEIPKRGALECKGPSNGSATSSSPNAPVHRPPTRKICTVLSWQRFIAAGRGCFTIRIYCKTRNALPPSWRSSSWVFPAQNLLRPREK